MTVAKITALIVDWLFCKIYIYIEKRSGKRVQERQQTIGDFSYPRTTERRALIVIQSSTDSAFKPTICNARP
jgi:hypothetical protein